MRSVDETTVDTKPAVVETTSPEVIDPRRDPAQPVLVEIESTSATTQTSAAARAREERYRELLRGAPSSQPNETPTAHPPQTAEAAEPPSLLDRVVKPIASALGMSRKDPPPQQIPPQRAQSQMSQNSSGAETEPPQQQKREEPLDEESDITPPRLLAAEFVPPQVQDGENTIFAAMVTDDLAGVRGVSGVVVSPSGAQQGFACQREGETGRFSARIAVPREAAEGTWTVKYLTLSDNAGNTTNLNIGQGQLPPTASFRVVSSASDSRPPVLKAVWLDQQSMGAGEKNSVFVQADDDKSGVMLISGVFVSPNKQARIGFGCRAGNGNVWQCPVAPPACVDCGMWQLEQVQLQDKANNMVTFRADNEVVANVRLDLFGNSCDAAAPTITALSVDPPVVSNAEPSIVRVTAVATDNQCGVASLSGQAMPPTGARLFFPFRPGPDAQTFIGEIQVPKHAAAGTWSVVWVQAIDKGHNMRAYSGNDPVLARVTFRVE